MTPNTINDTLSSIETAPTFFRKTTETKRFYKDLMSVAATQKKVTEADKLAAAMISEYYEIWRSAKRELTNEYNEITTTITTIGDKGQSRIVIHPAYDVYKTSFKEIMNGLKEFGLTPRSRKQVEELEQATESELLKFLKGGD